MHDELERNLRLIPIHELLVRTSPWIAVFVLFTRSNFELEGAVQLASIYYLSVAVLEVPSGWMSDRLGRALTLRVAGLAWVGSFFCFLVGNERFAVVVAGQVLLAAGYASLSGTDVTFHYDTLEALGRQSEYGQRQARVASRGLLFSAAGALLGGVLGLADLRLAFAASMVLAVVQFTIAMRFSEPPEGDGAAAAIVTQIARCLGYLRSAPLGWIFGYGIAMVVLEHVAFTLLQPWLTEALGRTANDFGSAPLFAGAMVAVVSIVGSIFARNSVALAARFGLRTVLVGLGVTSALIVSIMASSVHIAVVAVIAFRSAQGSAAPVLISAAVAPVVAQEHRATFLSLNSLAGRLAYGSLLLFVSTDAGDDVSRTLAQLAGISWALVALTLLSALLLSRSERS
ncbi:MAG: MFS family permease [Candidatus Poriferisodalaceae bacterium]|jgi:MFS family permease